MLIVDCLFIFLCASDAFSGRNAHSPVCLNKSLNSPAIHYVSTPVRGTGSYTHLTLGLRGHLYTHLRFGGERLGGFRGHMRKACIGGMVDMACA